MLSRRNLLASAAAMLLAPRASRAASITDDAGRAVPLPAKVTRVFPASPAAAVLLYTLAPDLLIAWPQALRAEECAYMLPAACARAQTGDLTDDTAALDSIVALKPDLIVDVGSTGETHIALADKIARQSSVPCALLDGRLLSLSTSYEKMGWLIGRENAGLDFADYVNMTLSVITNRIAFVPAEQRPRVYYARGPRGLTTARRGSPAVESIELMARNVAGDSKDGPADVGIEQIAQWNPDAIVTADRDFTANVRSDPAWATLAAVRKDRVYPSPTLPFDWLASPASANRLMGLWWLGKILYPDLFKDDLRELTRDYYGKFYHVTLSDAQIAHVLSGKA